MPFNLFRSSVEPVFADIDDDMWEDAIQTKSDVNELSQNIGENTSARNSYFQTRIRERYGVPPDEIVDTANAQIGDFLYCTGNIFSNHSGTMITDITETRFVCCDPVGNRKIYAKNRSQTSEEICVYKPCKELLDKFFDNVKSTIYWESDEGHLCDVVNVAKVKYPYYYEKLGVGVCSCCGNPAIPKITVDGVDYCNDCYNEKFTSCSRCGKIVKRGEEVRDRNDYALCRECGKRHWVLPYHGYYPKVEFYGDNKGNSVPYMGFELEVDCGGEDNKKVAKIMPLLNNEESGKVFAYCSHDGSLQNGFEIITQPATMQYHSSISDVYNRAIQKLKAMGYASHETTTCGFHVHFNRNFFGNNQDECIRRLIFMTEKFWNELCVFARRPERRLEHYAKKVSDSMEIKEYMEKANRSGRHEYHYYAVNIANDSTIEFRMFRGTLNLNTIMATLQLVNNMVIVAKNKTMDEIKVMRFEDLLTTAGQRKYWARHKAVADFEE